MININYITSFLKSNPTAQQIQNRATFLDDQAVKIAAQGAASRANGGCIDYLINRNVTAADMMDTSDALRAIASKREEVAELFPAELARIVA